MDEPKKRLYESLLALEEKAGISQEMTCARDGSLIPFVTPDEFEEYLGKAEDRLYRLTRNAYFSVPDMELRKKLIVALCEINILEATANNEAQKNIDSIVMPPLEQAVSVAAVKTRNAPWTEAALIAIGAVVVGNIVLGQEGGIAGAVAGIFLGLGCLAKAKNAADIGLKQATDKLEYTRKVMAQRIAWPDTFSRVEEISGERDVNLDLKLSPHANYRSLNKQVYILI